MDSDESSPPPRGRFITFEGIDGAGKSSHLEWFAGRLREQGHSVVVTREPGGSPLSEQLRDMMLHQPMTPVCESLLAFAARSEHVVQLIEPALARGDWVLCDRFTDSTFAYQGAGRGVAWQSLANIEAFVVGSLTPDVTFLFDLPAQEAARRRAAARAADRFEAEDTAFFERVRDGYRQRMSGDSQRFRLIETTHTMDEIRKLLELELVSI